MSVSETASLRKDQRNMSKKQKKRGNQIRDADRRSVAWLLTDTAYDTLCVSGYTRLSENPEVLMAVNKLAGLIGSMTIHLMANSEDGDIRIKNALSRKLDIEPNRYMTRMTLMSWIVRTLLLYGDGNAVLLPKTSGGYLEDLVPISHSRVSFVPDGGYGYRIKVDGQDHDPGQLLHFVLNPDPDQPWKGMGLRVALKDITSNLKQAAVTKKGFLEDKWKPSVIIKVDSWSEDLSTREGRENYLRGFSTDRPGDPMIIPADGMDVIQVKPLTLNDLAINDSVSLDKRSVASILGVPPYVVGVGAFNREEWNSFINNTVLPLVKGLEQELTRKLLISEDLFVRMNPWALYAYDVQNLASIGSELYVRGIMTGNEVRDWIGQGPRAGLDELVILENFIPASMIGDQLKLNQQKKNQEKLDGLGGESDG